MNSSISVVIIDDEPRARETIINILQLSTRDIQILGEGESVKTAYKIICETSPDLILLDINLPDGSGFDLLKMFDKINFRVIFITAHEEYAVNAFKFSAIDYILKPISAGSLLSAIDKACDAIDNDQMALKLNVLLNNLDKLKKIVLKTAESIHIINVEQIIRCEADVNYTHFYLDNAKHLIVSKPLKDYAEILEQAGFFRTHQSHLVNLEHIVRYDKTEGGHLVMDNESIVPVSTRKKDELLQVFEKM